MTAAIPVGLLERVLDLAGTFAFALSGGIAGVRHGLDLFGIIVLAFLTAVAGGTLRDVLIGSLPPDALQSGHGLALAGLAGVLAFCFSRPLVRVRWLLQHVDAAGLAVFAVTGARKALEYGLTPAMAAVLGMVTAVGGGILRDLMVAQIPTVLTSEVYAVAALLGGGVVAIGPMLHLQPGTSMLAGTALCLLLRLAGLYRHWALPIARAADAGPK